MTTLQSQALRVISKSSEPPTIAVIARATKSEHEGGLWRVLDCLRMRGLVTLSRGRWRISIRGRQQLERRRRRA